MYKSIRDDISFQHAMQTYMEQLAITNGMSEGDAGYEAQLEAELSAHAALVACIDAHTARAVANAELPALRAA